MELQNFKVGDIVWSRRPNVQEDALKIFNDGVIGEIIGPSSEGYDIRFPVSMYPRYSSNNIGNDGVYKHVHCYIDGTRLATADEIAIYDSIANPINNKFPIY